MAEFTFSIDLDEGGGALLPVDLAGDTLAVSTAVGIFMPSPWTAHCALVDFGKDLATPMGGAGQRLGRLGSRWMVTFSALPALAAAAARGIQAVRAKARANGSTLVFLWPQPAYTAAIGAPVVSGAGQQGSRLTVAGLTPGAVLEGATFFSFASAGRTYLHALTASATASGGGTATLSIAPMLRVKPAAGAPLNFATPAIEGYVQGQAETFGLQMRAWSSQPSFSVMEPA